MGGGKSTVLGWLIVTTLLAFLFIGFTTVVVMDHGRRLTELEEK